MEKIPEIDLKSVVDRARISFIVDQEEKIQKKIGCLISEIYILEERIKGDQMELVRKNNTLKEIEKGNWDSLNIYFNSSEIKR